MIDGVGAVHFQIAADLQGLRTFRRIEAPIVPARHRGQRQAIVPHQVFRRLRHAVALDIFRRGAADPPVRRQLTGDQRVVVDLFSEPDRDVDLFRDEVQRPVAQFQNDPHIGIVAHEARQMRQKLRLAESDRRRDAQGPLRMVAQRDHRGLGLRHFLGDFDAAAVEGFALFRQRHAARGAVQQTHAQPVFQLSDLLADRRRGQPFTSGRSGKPAFLHDFREQQHLRREVHFRLRPFVPETNRVLESYTPSYLSIHISSYCATQHETCATQHSPHAKESRNGRFQCRARYSRAEL